MVALSELDKARAFILKAVLLPQRGIWEMRFLKKKKCIAGAANAYRAVSHLCDHAEAE